MFWGEEGLLHFLTKLQHSFELCNIANKLFFLKDSQFNNKLCFGLI